MTSLKEVFGSEHSDWVAYYLFPPHSADDNEEELEQLSLQLNAAAQSLSGEYIWHNEPFVLRRSRDWRQAEGEGEEAEGEGKLQENNAFFHGITRFGENLEDEWFIVYVLKELSKQFPQLVIRVEDNDGEFLLIEAADYLPKWAESDEICKNRVFIQQGQVHIIPLNVSSKKTILSVKEGVELVRTRGTDTLAKDGVQKAVNLRIGNYPVKMYEENFYHANIMLPPLLASILNEKPALVAAGTGAFYLRDPINLKVARLMTNFQPGTSGLVKSKVRFTKYLYAMLMKQDFRPDRRSGWPSFSPAANPQDFKAHSLGAKLTIGFEILVNQCTTTSDAASSSVENSVADTNPKWTRYLEALKKTGYFKDFLEGSKPYQNLLASAKLYFATNLLQNPEVEQSSSSWQDIAALEVKRLMQTVEVNKEKLETIAASLSPDDDDSWLSINPEDLDSLLEAKFKSGGLNPDEIPNKLKNFIKKISDFSGVECGESGNGNDGGGGGDNQSSSSNSPRENGLLNEEADFVEPLDFKADEFVSAMDKLLHDLGAHDPDWDPSEDDSEVEDEDEPFMDLDSIKNKHKFSKETREFFGLMNQMDKELASTTVGKTFSNGEGSKSKPKPSSSSSSSSTQHKATVDELDEFDEDEGLTPVNIDMNALANMLESLTSEEGFAGPSSNLLRSAGISNPNPTKKNKSKKK